MSYCKRNNFIKKFYQNVARKLVPGPFVFENEISQHLLENEIFEASYLYWICNSKAFEICSNHHAGLLRIVFTEDSLKIKKDLGLVFKPHF